LLAAVVGAVLLSGVWHAAASLNVFGIELSLQNIVRDMLLLIIAGISYFWTPTLVHKENHFNWEPVLEVAKLFAGIFATIVPVIAILQAGRDGALASLVNMVTTPSGNPINPAYFW